MHIPLVEAQVSVYTPWQIVLVDIPTFRTRVDTLLAASTSACAVFTDRLVWFGPYSPLLFVLHGPLTGILSSFPGPATCIHTLANCTCRHTFFPDAGRPALAASMFACAVFTDRLVFVGPHSPLSRALDRNPLSCLCGGREATHDALLSRHRILILGRQGAKCNVQ